MVIISSLCLFWVLGSLCVCKSDAESFAKAAASRDSEMATEDVQDPRIAKIASSIRVIPDFPKPGLLSFYVSTRVLLFKPIIVS